MLHWRLISSAVIISALLAIVWLDYRQAVFHTPGAWLLPVLLVVSWLGTGEVLSLLRAKGHRPIAWIVYLGNLCIPLAASLSIVGQITNGTAAAPSPLGPVGWPLICLVGFSALVLIGEMARYERGSAAIVNAALAVFTLVYIGVSISFLSLLRQFDGNNWGMAALISTLLIVKMADTGAFTVGKNFGRTKMTPLLSPGKTWEGAFGGIFVACVTSWAFFHFAAPRIVGTNYYVEPPIWAAIAYGALLAVAGLIGDLAESLLKRDMERKDSSTWLPGLGGVLDIIDAVLFAAPVAWLCWMLGLVGP